MTGAVSEQDAHRITHGKAGSVLVVWPNVVPDHERGHVSAVAQRLVCREIGSGRPGSFSADPAQISADRHRRAVAIISAVHEPGKVAANIQALCCLYVG